MVTPVRWLALALALGVAVDAGGFAWIGNGTAAQYMLVFLVHLAAGVASVILLAASGDRPAPPFVWPACLLVSYALAVAIAGYVAVVLEPDLAQSVDASIVRAILLAVLAMGLGATTAAAAPVMIAARGRARPIRDGLLRVAADMRRRIEKMETPNPDQLELEDDQAVDLAERSHAQDTDFRTALCATRDALDLIINRTAARIGRPRLDAWLKRAPGPIEDIMTTKSATAYDRFRASMEIGYEEWHDGVPYEMEALDEMTPEERQSIAATLVARTVRRRRDIQALACIGTPAARAAIRADAEAGDENTRLYAAESLAEMGEPVNIGPLIVAALEQDDLFGGMDQALSLAGHFPSEEVKAVLLSGSREATDDRGIHFAALLHHIHGLIDEAFDWDRRPFYLRFGPDDPVDRAAAYRQLYADIGVDA